MQRSNRPFVNFRPTQEVSDEITALGTKNGLTNAEISSQLFLCGLKELHKGKFSFDRRPLLTPAPTRIEGSTRGLLPDKRHSRATGEKIRKARESRKKGGKANLGEINAKTTPESTPGMELNSNE